MVCPRLLRERMAKTQASAVCGLFANEVGVEVVGVRV